MSGANGSIETLGHEEPAVLDCGFVEDLWSKVGLERFVFSFYLGLLVKRPDASTAYKSAAHTKKIKHVSPSTLEVQRLYFDRLK